MQEKGRAGGTGGGHFISYSSTVGWWKWGTLLFVSHDIVPRCSGLPCSVCVCVWQRPDLAFCRWRRSIAFITVRALFIQLPVHPTSTEIHPLLQHYSSVTTVNNCSPVTSWKIRWKVEGGGGWGWGGMTSALNCAEQSKVCKWWQKWKKKKKPQQHTFTPVKSRGVDLVKHAGECF